MNTMTAKFILPAVLAVAICGLGVSVGYAFETSCSFNKKKTVAFCTNDDPGDHTLWRCDKQKNGSWKCSGTQVHKMTSVPTGLSDALNEARISAKKRAAP